MDEGKKLPSEEKVKDDGAAETPSTVPPAIPDPHLDDQEDDDPDYADLDGSHATCPGIKFRAYVVLQTSSTNSPPPSPTKNPMPHQHQGQGGLWLLPRLAVLRPRQTRSS